MLHALAAGRRLGMAGRRRRQTRRTAEVLATLLACAEKHRLAEVSPMVCDMTTRSGWRFRCAAGWCGAGGSSELRTEDRAKTCCRASHRCSTARCFGRRRSRRRRSRFPAVRARRRGRDAPSAGALGAAVRHLPERGVSASARSATSSSRSWAGGCTPSIPTTPPSGSSPTATAAICCRSPACGSCCHRSGSGSAGSSWCPAAIRPG